MANKLILEDKDYNSLKLNNIVVLDKKLAVGKEYKVISKENKEEIYARCSQSYPFALKKYDPIKKEYL